MLCENHLFVIETDQAAGNFSIKILQKVSIGIGGWGWEMVYKSNINLHTDSYLTLNYQVYNIN